MCAETPPLHAYRLRLFALPGVITGVRLVLWFLQFFVQELSVQLTLPNCRVAFLNPNQNESEW
jgi:hypothetical protein